MWVERLAARALLSDEAAGLPDQRTVAGVYGWLDGAIKGTLVS